MFHLNLRSSLWVTLIVPSAPRGMNITPLRATGSYASA